MTARPLRTPAGPGWRRSRAAVAGLALVAVLAPAAGASPDAKNVGPQGRGQPSLSLTCSDWVFPSRPLSVTLQQSGVLAGRALAVDLFVDENQWQRVTTKGGRTAIRVELPPLAPGNHVLVARSAREVSRSEFRVVSWSWLVGGGSAAVAAAGVLFALVRRRPRS